MDSPVTPPILVLLESNSSPVPLAGLPALGAQFPLFIDGLLSDKTGLKPTSAGQEPISPPLLPTPLPSLLQTHSPGWALLSPSLLFQDSYVFRDERPFLNTAVG